MGHLLFIVLHVIAVVFGMVLLFVTIPAHLIYAAVSQRSSAPARPIAAPDAPSPLTHVRCPDCRELVRNDASKCKHCGTALVPAPIEAPATADWRPLWITIAIVLGFIVLGGVASRFG